MRVLVCDDAEPVRRLLVLALDSSGCSRVEEVETAEAALDVLDAGDVPVDVIVLDHSLPGISGLDAVRHLRRRGATTPVVLFSGDPDVGRQVRADDDVVHLVKGEMSITGVISTIRALAERNRNR